MIARHRVTTDGKRSMLRHTMATLAYRAGKTLRGAPEPLRRAPSRFRVESPGADSGPHGRSHGLGLVHGRRQAGLAGFRAPRLERGGGTLLRRPGAVRRVPRLGRLGSSSPKSACSRGLSPMPSGTRVNWRCSGDWPAHRSGAKTTASPRSRPGASESSRHRRGASSTDRHRTRGGLPDRLATRRVSLRPGGAPGAADRRSPWRSHAP